MQRQAVTHTHRPVGIRVHQRVLLYIHRAILVAALVGLFASVYLFVTYVSRSPIACGVLQGCEIVRASQWAYVYGIPRPLLGVVFYVGVIGLLAFRSYAPAFRPQWWRWALLGVSAIGFIESAYLTFLQWHDIHAYCAWCLTSAVVATIIFVLSWFDGREPIATEVIVNELKFIFAVFATAIVGGIIALHFLLGNTLGGFGVSVLSR